MKASKLTTVAIQAGVTPFVEGYEVAGIVYGAGKIQGSDDGVTYVDLVTGVAGDITVGSFQMKAYMKTDVGDAYLLGGA